MIIKLIKKIVDSDLYLIHCYIPPEDSRLYKDVNSPLYDYAFFYCILNEINQISISGDVIITGDLHARTGQRSDLVEDLNVQRYVDLPTGDIDVSSLPTRYSQDNRSNVFGNKLLTLC